MYCRAKSMAVGNFPVNFSMSVRRVNPSRSWKLMPKTLNKLISLFCDTAWLSRTLESPPTDFISRLRIRLWIICRIIPHHFSSKSHWNYCKSISLYLKIFRTLINASLCHDRRTEEPGVSKSIRFCCFHHIPSINTWQKTFSIDFRFFELSDPNFLIA